MAISEDLPHLEYISYIEGGRGRTKMKGKKINLFSYTSLTVFRASNFIILPFSKYNWQDQNWVIMRSELLGVRQYKSYLPTN